MNTTQSKTLLSVIIPTYRREQVLLDSIEALLLILPKNTELLIVDQTEKHTSNVAEQLERYYKEGRIRWITEKKPSITKAMNRGAREAVGKILLFVDDDIVPDQKLIDAHLDAHSEENNALIAGRVMQPWHEDDHEADMFTSRTPELIPEFIGCNFSIPRRLLMKLGGFDENFKGAAYRYEREFADRLREHGCKIVYEPRAWIRHLHTSSGGTRSKGDHLTSWNPRHPVGAYYYLYTSPLVKSPVYESLKRLFGSVVTRHHLRAPWYIPVTWVSELAGMFWAVILRIKGPALPFKNHRENSEPL